MPTKNLVEPDDILNKSLNGLEKMADTSKNKLKRHEENMMITKMNLTVERKSLIHNLSRIRLDEKLKKACKSSKTKLAKKFLRKKISPYNYLKYQSVEYSNYKVKTKRKEKEHKLLQSKSSQPVRFYFYMLNLILSI